MKALLILWASQVYFSFAKYISFVIFDLILLKKIVKSFALNIKLKNLKLHSIILKKYESIISLRLIA